MSERSAAKTWAQELVKEYSHNVCCVLLKFYESKAITVYF